MRVFIDRHFRAVLDGAPDGVLVECSERIAYVNPAYARLLHYANTNELAGATIRDIAHPDDLERLTWFGRCRSEGRPAPTRYTFRAKGGDQSIVTFDASISQSRVDGEMLITSIVRELAAPAELEFDLPGTKRLSPRELDVLRGLLRGKRSKEIALEMGVSEKTIHTHRSRAFQKLALRGVADLFRVASEHMSAAHRIAS
jgi:PAS domain S-box-containing protein